MLGRRNGAATDSLIDVDWIEVLTADRTRSLPASPTPAVTPSPAGASALGLGLTATPGPGTPAPGSPPCRAPTPGIAPRIVAHRHSLLELLCPFRQASHPWEHGVISPTFYAGRFAQYFEKGRMEDHTGESNDPNWQFQYEAAGGRLRPPARSARGERFQPGLRQDQCPGPAKARIAPPASFGGGTIPNSDGSVFITLPVSTSGRGTTCPPSFGPI